MERSCVMASRAEKINEDKHSREAEMRNSFLNLIAIGAATLALSPNLAAQVVQFVELLEKNGPGEPAPRRDLYGMWAGPRGRGREPSPFPPAGLARFQINN